MIIRMWLIAFLIICAITDLTERHVYTMFCLANGIIIGIMQFFMQNIGFSACIFGGLIGAICFFVCLVSRDSIGKGDALIIGIIGIALGFQETLEVLVWSFIIITFVGIIGIWRKRMKLKTKLPFIPFVLLGTVATFLIRG